MRIRTLRRTLEWAFVAGVFMGFIGLLAFDGPPSLFAQTDTTAPTVSSVAITSDTGDDEVYLDDDGVYGIGDEVEVTVTFNENVVVTGSPQLELNIGGSPEIASYDSTDGSKVVFGYTVAVGDSDTDSISIAADKLSLNGGTIKDAAGNSADLSHSAEAAQTGHKVDGIRPTITAAPLFSGSTYSTDGVHTIGEELIANVHFSENVYVGGNPGPQLKLNIRGTAKSADFFSAVPECNEPGLCLISFSPFDRHGIRLIFEYEIVRGDLDLDGVAIDANSLVLNGGSIRDGAGNDAVLAHSAAASNHIVDGVPATIKSIDITSDPGEDDTYRMDDVIEVTVTFSESVRARRWVGSGGVVNMPRLELNIGGAAKLAKTHERATITGTAIVFRYTVQDGDNDSDGISIGANKLTTRGNLGITDNYSGCCPGGNNADLTHEAVADDAGHKVAASSQPSDKSTDATLKGLSLSDMDFGTFASDTESYTATVPYSVYHTAVIPTVNHSGARYVTKLGGVNAADGTVSLAVGSNDITIVVTAEDGSTTKTYTVSVTRAEPSTDATLKGLTLRKGLTLSGIDFGTFASGTESYTATVANDVAQILVHARLNDSRARYVTKIGGVLAWPNVLWTEVSLATGVNVITIEVTAEDGSTTKTYTVTVTREAASTDATLKGLTLSGIDFGTFASGTESYTAEVTNTPTETTVTPTVNHSGASYVIKLGGVVDADGTVSLAAGDNVITIEVTAEDGQATRTYTVTVTRLVAQESNQASSDATLSALTLSGIDFGTFASGTTSYSASVANSVSQTTVTPTVNDDGASYVVKLGGVTDADGTVSLAVGSNVITVEVTAEDDSTTETYTITVTRAAPSTDATLEWLALSGIDIGNGLGHRRYPQTQTSFTASVYNSVAQTTVTAMANQSGASYVVKLGGVTDSDGVISLAVDSNVITVEVTAEDGQTTRTYTATVTRAAASAPTTGELSTDDPRVNFRTISYTHTYVALTFSIPRNRGITGTVTQRYKHDGDNFESAGEDGRYENTSDDDLGGLNLSWTYTEPEPDTLYKWVAKMLNSQSATVIETSLTVRTPPEPGTTTLSSDATLSDLTLSDVDFEATDRTFVGSGFHSTVTSYVGTVANSVSQTTVTPTVNDDGASYVIKLGGVTDPDGTVSLSGGSNVITVEVTAEDLVTTRTYTVTVTRSAPPSTDATLSALTLSGVNFGTFASGTTSYTAQVANIVSQTTVTPTVNHSGASYVIKLGGVTDADGTVSLAVGSNVIAVEVTAEDESTTETYTVTVTRAAPPSTDATLKSLTLSEIDFGKFLGGTTSYSAQVTNSVSQTTVTATTNDSEASYVIKLGGVIDADGTVSLAVDSNVITVEVTAEDESTTKTYTVTVTRAEPPSTDATLKGLTLSGIDFGSFDSTTTSYSAQVANSVSQTTVAPTVNDSAASYVIKLGGVTDAGGVIALSVGGNVITVEVTAEDGSTTKTYTVTVTRAEPPSTDATLSALTLSGIDFGTFSSDTTSYTASVANSVSQTTVTPTVNDSGASYVIRLGGVIDADDTVSLVVGSNVITVEVTAEDDKTTQTYTVTLTREEPSTPEQLSGDASLSALALSGINFGTFDSTTTSYTAQVANSVAQTTVTPTPNHSEASYVIRLGGVMDADGVIVLSVGSNVITVEVTAEDESTTETYTVTVTRAAPLSTDATLRALTLTGVNFGTFDSTTTSYTAQVASSVSQTTVTPTLSDSGASYVIKLGGVTDADGVISLAVGSNVITVGVTAQNGTTKRTYTVTVTRASQDETPPRSPDPVTGELPTDDPKVNFRVSSYTHDSVGLAWSVPQNRGITRYVVQRHEHDGSGFVSSGSGVGARFEGNANEGGGHALLSSDLEPDTLYQYVLMLKDGGGATIIESSSSVRTLSTDATLSALSLSGIDFGTFDPATTSYTAEVGTDVSQATVSPTASHSGASYTIELDGAAVTNGEVTLEVGENIITVEVTAEDGETKLTYTVTVTRMASSLLAGELPTDDPPVNFRITSFGEDEVGLAWEIPRNRGVTGYVLERYDHDGTEFAISDWTVSGDASGGSSYSHSNTGLSADSWYRFDLSLKSDTGTVIIETSLEVRTRATGTTALSADATLSALSLSGVELDADFSSSTYRYTGSVANDVTLTTATATLSDAAASYVVNLGGTVDDDGVIDLGPGRNVITVRVTAEDGATTRIYTAVVTRAKTADALSSDATLRSLSLSGLDFGAFETDTTSYTAEVANDVTQTTVTPVRNDVEATHVIKLNGTVDEDSGITLEVGENVITVEVTAEDGETALTYTVTITREEISLLTGELASDDPPVNFRITSYDEDEVSLSWEIPNNRGITGYELERYDHDGTEFISSGWSVSRTVTGGSSATESNTALTADSRYRYDLVLTSDTGATIIEKSLEVRARAAGTSALSADTALSALSLSGVALAPDFSSSTYRYTGNVATDVTQITVTATLNDSAASYAVKLGGAVDEDGMVDLMPGRNVITVHVTAEDGVTTGVYTAVVTRAKTAEALSTDASLRSLSLSGIDFGTFDPETTEYTAQVTHDTAQTTVTPVRNDVEAAHVINLGEVEDTDGVIDLAVGANVITVEVTAEDGETTSMYTITVTRDEAAESDPDPAPEPEPADTCVRSVEADGAIAGSWDDTCLSGKSAPGGTGDRYARFYTLTLDEATDIVINLSSDEDTYLYLLAGHGKGGDTLHSNDDIASGGVNLNSRLSVTLQPGDYTIEATTYSPETSVAFTLTMAGLGQAEAPAPDPQPVPEPEPEAGACIESVDGDATVEASWDDGCLSDKAALSGTGDRYARFYTFTLDEVADVTITLESDEDAYLYLLSGHGRSGTVLYEEDDIVYGVNTNSRLSENLDAGDYTIEATTYYAQTDGDFTLTIEELVASP